MAFGESNSNGLYMPVAPAYGGGGSFGGWGGDSGWFILLILLAMGNGAWGGWGGLGGMMGPAMMMGGGMGYDFPWLMAGQQNINTNTSNGFRDAQISGQISGLRSDVTGGFRDVQLGISGLGRDICQTGYQVTGAVRDGFYGAEVAAQGRHNALTGQLYQGEINALNRSFAEQTANMQGFNGVNASLADVKYTEATEACNTRTQAATNTRDIIDAQTRGTQAILDKLCQLELDGIKGQLAQAQRENVGLQNQINMANFAASQVDQTAQLRANQAAVANQLVSELRSCPIPSQPVYGNQPIFACSGPSWGNSGCGCGGNLGIAG